MDLNRLALVINIALRAVKRNVTQLLFDMDIIVCSLLEVSTILIVLMLSHFNIICSYIKTLLF